MPTFQDFNQNLQNASRSFGDFAQSLPRSIQGLTGLTDSLHKLSATVAGVGAVANALGIIGKPFAVGLGAAGFAGIAGAGLANASMGLAGAASPNGLDSVNKAFDILAGTVGRMLLPGFVLLGVQAIKAADWIDKWIDKNLDWALDKWIEAVDKATDAAKEFGRWLKNPTGSTANWAMDQLQKLDRMIDPNTNKMIDPLGRGGTGIGKSGVGPFAGMTAAQAALARQMGFDPDIVGGTIGVMGDLPFASRGRAAIAGRRGLAGLGVGSFGAGAREPGRNDADLIREFARDMQQSMLRPSITDPVGKWKEVAMQIQNSELEQRRLQMFQKGIDAVNRLAEIEEKRAAQRGEANRVNGPVVGGRIRIPGGA